MIHLSLDLFYAICNTINKPNQRQNHYHSLMFPIQFDIYLEVINKVLQ